jgi:long-chain acyl-CoA synthetase
MGTIASNMKELSIDGFDTVPRILEKIFDNVVAKGKNLKGVKKKIYYWAINLGLKYRLPDESSWFYRKKHAFADKMVYSKWREALGGRIRIAGCGGASLQPRLERLFWAAGIKVLNMYGLTETSPIITINRQEKPLVKLGSVGALIDGVEMKIADDGEILTRGHNVMLGYYRDPEMTSEVIDKEGWFHTGDIGSIEDGKFLMITDRKKEIFKLSNGKYIAPQIIEGKLKESVFVDQSLVIGEMEKSPGAIISPDFNYLANWCKNNGLDFTTNDEMISLPQVRNIFRDEINKLNKILNHPERISRYKIVPHIWGPDTGELSPTLKLKRKFVHAKYEKDISEIFRKTNP